MAVITVIALGAVITVILLYTVQWLERQTMQAVFKRKNGCLEPAKYPHKDPILGLDLFLRMGKAVKAGRMLETCQQLFEQHGSTFEVNSWGTTVINTREPKNIQTVLALAFDNFGVVPVKQKVTGGSFMAQGIFTADGAIWARSRALIRPTFARPQIANFESLELHVNRFLNLLPTDGSTVDLQPIIKRLFLDTSTEFLFGESTGCLLPNTPFDSTEFLEAFDTSMAGLGVRMQLGKYSFILGSGKQWKKAGEKVHAYIGKHVERVLRQQEQAYRSDKEMQQTGRMPNRYILLDEMAKETQDPDDLRYQLLHVFFPAHDATGIAVSDMIFHLARDHVRWAKLRREILAATDSAALSFELLKSMHYLRYVFNESLRLHPSAGRLRRVCHKDTILPLGGGPGGRAPVLVSKGTSIVMDIHAMHRDVRLWGENAAEFYPERWEKVRPTWEYLPFSGGPRICPAQQMVFTEAAYIIVRLAQKYSQLENQDPEPWTELLRMTTENKNGVQVKLVPA